jgi:hypothetical protein
MLQEGELQFIGMTWTIEHQEKPQREKTVDMCSGREAANRLSSFCQKLCTTWHQAAIFLLFSGNPFLN